MTAARKLRETCSTGTDCWMAPSGLAAMNAVVGGSTQRSATITSACRTNPTARTLATRRTSVRWEPDRSGRSSCGRCSSRSRPNRRRDRSTGAGPYRSGPATSSHGERRGGTGREGAAPSSYGGQPSAGRPVAASRVRRKRRVGQRSCGMGRCSPWWTRTVMVRRRSVRSGASACEVREDDDVVGVVPGVLVEGAAAGDQPQPGVVEVAVDGVAGEGVLGVLLDPVDDEDGGAAVGAVDLHGVAGHQLVQAGERAGLALPVDVPGEDGGPEPAGGGAAVVPADR